jgi:multiple sugar transport system permease protein
LTATVVPTPTGRDRRGSRGSRVLATVAHHTVLIGLTVMFLAPVAFIALTAVMSDSQALSHRLWPHPFVWSNFTTIFDLAPMWRFAQNTLLIAALSTLGVLVSCVPVAYALSHLEWKGRRLALFAVLATYMLPAQATIVPLYIVFAKLHWTGTLKPLIIPAFFANAFDVFLLRQFFLTIPGHLLDAARMEGASELRVLTRVVLPIARPALAAVALLHFVFVWNDLFGPLLYLGENRDLWTLTLGLSEFRSQHAVEWNLTMAASLLYILPIVALFLLAQRWVIDSVKVTGRA